jgi:hypothetical protein
VTKPAFRSHRLKDGLCEGSSGGFAEDPSSLDVAIDERGREGNLWHSHASNLGHHKILPDFRIF